MGLANDVWAQIGLIMLVGLLGKNAILIVEFAVQRRQEGVSLRDAAIEGGKLRFRPIQMTSFAFIAGLIPLVVATGAGAIGNRTIGTTGVGGMLVGTVVGRAGHSRPVLPVRPVGRRAQTPARRDGHPSHRAVGVWLATSSRTEAVRELATQLRLRACRTCGASGEVMRPRALKRPVVSDTRHMPPRASRTRSWKVPIESRWRLPSVRARWATRNTPQACAKNSGPSSLEASMATSCVTGRSARLSTSSNAAAGRGRAATRACKAASRLTPRSPVSECRASSCTKRGWPPVSRTKLRLR